MSSPLAPCIGIDIGTSSCLVAVSLNGKVEVIANDQGNRTTPSYVAFTEEERLVGEPAKSQIVVNAENTIFDTKRLIGRQFSDPTLPADTKHWPFKVVEGSNGSAAISVQYKNKQETVHPEEVYSVMLTKMKETAEAYLGKPVAEAVITVPAVFTDLQREAVRTAAKMAGLNVRRALHEPTAAALAYGLDKMKKKRTVLVFDLGGGSLDVTILAVEKDLVEVLATAGDMNLGGEDFDNRLVHYFIREFNRKHKKDISGNARSLRRLRNACESAKRTLSTLNQASLEIDSLFEGIDFFSSVPRVVLEDLCSDLFQSTIKSVEKALNDAELDTSQITDVVLSGGCSRIPKIQSLLQEYFGGRELKKSINPDEVVAYGAAVHAENSSTPAGNEGGIGSIPTDVVALSIGVELNDGRFLPIISRGTTLPATGDCLLTCIGDDEKNQILRIYEGERTSSRENHLLGTVDLSKIFASSDALVELDVTISVDKEGQIEVIAEDRNGDEVDVRTVIKPNRLPDKEIRQRLQEAEKFKLDDEIFTETASAKSSLTGLMFNAVCLLKDDLFKTSVTDSDRKLLTVKCEEITKWMESQKGIDQDSCITKQKELEVVVRDVIDRVYEIDQEALTGVTKAYAPDKKRRNND